MKLKESTGESMTSMSIEDRKRLTQSLIREAEKISSQVFGQNSAYSTERSSISRSSDALQMNLAGRSSLHRKLSHPDGLMSLITMVNGSSLLLGHGFRTSKDEVFRGLNTSPAWIA